ncbi:hypothetical protein LOTGIDRAFT_196428 [Lottia gigantea]|uniref:RING-type E3 ubiquitin transferase n=1 Tax=Lottia gigantea TaxID=225164 RepID=V3ZV02_LOTGI|nr:hypothetical protein LOTGIDRAFT_196428 [Lottia gigantea]ESO84776.1 hypothetical protein LOTGIDRAFT_196428 [Lottia gigantea]
MPSEAPLLQTEVEKPQHFTYLKEFRTQQCPLFLQHKCTLHRPFTCFHWHFLNQRRRRPVRRRDGTFNYSPDIYCTKYDETTGICPNGNDCPYLHRTAGDTERRYHLRYYKTGTCVYETDPRGHCAKNGPHCAFAHGAGDLRPPVYDIHELKTVDQIDLETISTSPSSLEKEQILSEDPKWNDTNYVLHYYKTEPCKRPPRLCRQGYACPQYHNSKDRRRSPKNNKYRSTPCPNVKHSDEWGDPTLCESGDSCPYCHTRTEQQFHTEIYKSTKCNDMVQSGYCPRGPFCAFAHVEQFDNDNNSVSSSISCGLSASGCLGSISGPIGIPPNKIHQRGSVGSLSQSPPSPFGSYVHSMLPLHQLSSPFLGHPSSSKYPNSFTEINSMSPRSAGPQSPHSLYNNNNHHNNNNHSGDRIKDSKTKITDIETVFRTACDNWKKAADDSLLKAKKADEEKLHAVKQRDEAVSQTQRLRQEIDRLKGGPYLRCLVKANEVESIPITQLRHIRQQLQSDLERIDKVISESSVKCVACQDKTKTVTTLPCNHRVLCDSCTARSRECPLCQVKINISHVKP